MIIECKNISKVYSEKKVLNDINFSLNENKCLGILGRNGVGKSTLLKIILDIINPTSGNVLYFNDKQLDIGTKKKIGFYLGKDYLPLELTGYQFLKLINHVYNLNCDNTRIKSIFSFFFGNDEYLNKPMATYSFGMIQKIGTCSAIFSQPKILVLDEPFIGLDSASTNNLLNFLNSYKNKNSIIITSHSSEIIEKLCDDILIIENGTTQYSGSLSNFIINSKDGLGNYFTQQDDKIEKVGNIDWILN